MYCNYMLWSDFATLLRRNTAPSVQLQFYGPLANNNIITICDSHLARRRGVTATKYGHYEDFMRDTMVGNACWNQGLIPYKSSDGEILTNSAEDGQEMTGFRGIERGIKDVVTMLLTYGCLRETKEISKVLGKDCRGMAGDKWYA